ncbi:NH(3)-dependent NAD(+) synthetase-like [Zophobas morio]|uniref:NH(3)-dependent NAD(+) synthetase-like n=1 Tax=Zophobas morio TaxID=2755281 RepID=UPI0030829B18
MKPFHESLVERLLNYRAERKFSSKEWISKKIDLLNNYFLANKLKACCISLSGGIDSAVVLALAKKAQEEPYSPIERVVAISQPILSSDWALQRAKECAKKFNSEFVVIDQTDLHFLLKNKIDKALEITGGKFASGQLRSYMRTPSNYYVAQLLSQEGLTCAVLGTGNKDEDGYLAYFCKAGDGVVDIQLIADLHKSEVFQVGRALGVPCSILDAKPSADLWAGQEDEDELGFPYDFVELFTGKYLPLSEEKKELFLDSLGKEARDQFLLWKSKAESIHYKNCHKFNFPVNLNVL